MFLRRIVAPAAALAIGAAFIPLSASAATPRPGSVRGSTQLMTKAAAPAFKTFSSPASKPVRLQKAATAMVKSRSTATGTTIYVAGYEMSCTNGSGAGSQASPYCSIQDAVNAAVPGDTVAITGLGIGPDRESVTISTSGISVVGLGDQAWVGGTNNRPAFLIENAGNVTISNLMVFGAGAPAIEIAGSSAATIDSDYVSGGYGDGSTGVIEIDGNSSQATVSRTYVDTGRWTTATSAISVGAGARDITLTSDIVAASGISATGVDGLDIVGNTVQRGCAPGIAIEGASTRVHIENNLLEDANPNTDGIMGGYRSQCTAGGLPWSPDIAVAADAAAATSANYNDFYVYGDDGTAPYSWSGTAYPTLAEFQSEVGQAAQDTMDSKEALPVLFRPSQLENVDVKPVAGSAAVGSADGTAPGEPSSDFYGVSPYTSRGAVQYGGVDPELAVSLTARQTSALGMSLDIAVSPASSDLSVGIQWGDGFPVNTELTINPLILSRSYGHAGTYTIAVMVAGSQRNTYTNDVTVTTAGSDYAPYGPLRILDTRKGTGTGGVVATLPANQSLKLQVTGSGPAGGTIPADATAVVLNLTVTDPATAGYLTAYPNQDATGAPQSRPKTSNVDFPQGRTAANLAIIPVGKDGVVDLYNGGGGGINVIADVTGYFTPSAPDGYVALAQDRLVDTRKGIGAAQAQLAAGKSLTVQITGTDGGQIPTSAVAAVALNVTTVNAHDGGYLTVYPDLAGRPATSSLDFGAGQVVANAVIVPVGADGKIDVYNGSAAGTDVLVDVVGYYSPAGVSAYLPIAPTRVLDTRKTGSGAVPASSYALLYSAESVSDPRLAAFMYNTTVVNTKGSGYETVAPDPNPLAAYQNGTALWPTPPTASTLDWSQGQVLANSVQASTGAHGIIDFWNRSGASTDLVIDEFGYYQGD